MPGLRVTIDGTSTVISPGRTYRIGRALDADITLHQPSCSRRHAEVVCGDSGWEIVDVGSSHGTYVAGEKVGRARLNGRTTVWFSKPTDGDAVVFEPVADRPGGGVDAVPDPALLGTLLPGDATGSGVTGAAPALILRWDGRDHFFGPGAVVRIGRDGTGDMIVSHPSVSRQHALITSVGDGWRYDDVSNSGSYVNGRRVQQLDLVAATSIRLGDPTTGAELLITPVTPPGPAADAVAGAARHRRRRRVGLASVAALLVLSLLAFVGWQLTANSADEPPTTAPSHGTEPTDVPQRPDDGLSAAELGAAKLATVMLTAQSRDGRGNPVAWGGSGSLISADGLILTNAHVAAPQSMGLAEIYGPNSIRDPDFLLVSLTREADDLPAAPAYRARLVASDGQLDAALLKIVATATGQPLPDDALDLPTIPIGVSSKLRTGDNLTVLGFPAISDSAALSVTRGVVSTFIADRKLGSERAEIDTDARISPGNSGGMAIDDGGELVGIPSAYRQDAGVPIVSGRIRPIDLVKPLIADVEGRVK